MSTLNSHLDAIYKQGLELLEELRSEEPDLDHIERLYRKRAEKIAFLEKSFKFPPSLADNEADEVTSLFEQLDSLEKHLNRKLHNLRQSRLDEIKRTSRHGKARESYLSNRSDGAPVQSKIIDLKTHG